MLNPKMLKQFERMQADMMKAQEELGELAVEGSAGGGAVVVVLNGHQEVQSVTIDPEFVDPEDVETLQDAIVAAFQNAFRCRTDHLEAPAPDDTTRPAPLSPMNRSAPLPRLPRRR